MGGEPRVRELREPEFDGWGRLVTNALAGSVYSTPEYLDVLCRVTGGRFRLVGVWLGDELCGGAALYEEPRWYGTVSGPRLLLYYHSPVVRRYETLYPSQSTSRHLKILAALARHLARTHPAGLTLKCAHTLRDVRVFAETGWRCSPSYTYVVPLGDLDAQWHRVAQNLRRLVKRAESEGIAVTDDEDVDAFYRLHAATMVRKGAGVYLSRDAFRLYAQRLRAQNLCRLYHARLPDGAAIAGQLVLLGPDGMSHTVMAVSDEAHLQCGASALLRWRVFEALAGLGFAANDLTDAALNPVTRFKSQLGGNLELCHVLERLPARPYRLARLAGHVAERMRRAAGGALRRIAPGRRRSGADRS